MDPSDMRLDTSKLRLGSQGSIYDNMFARAKRAFQLFRLERCYSKKNYSKVAVLLNTLEKYKSVKTDAFPILFRAIEEENREAFSTIYTKVSYKEDLQREDQNELKVPLLPFAYLEKKFQFAHFMEELGFNVNQSNSQGQNALHLSIIYSSQESFLKLLEKNIDLNKQDHYGNTPLHYACRAGNLQLINCLLLAQAKHLKNIFDQYPIHAAIQSQSLDAVLLLQEQLKVPYFGLMSSAAKTNFLTVMKMLYAQDKMTINERSQSSIVPLHHAAAYQAKEAAAFLLQKPGIVVDVQDDNGNTPLHLAFIAQNIELIRMLIAKGANLDIQNKVYLAPVDYGISGQSKEIRMMLQGLRNVSSRLSDWSSLKY